MEKLTIACAPSAINDIATERAVFPLGDVDLTEVSAVVLDLEAIKNGRLEQINSTSFGLPVFAALKDGEKLPEELVGKSSRCYRHQPHQPSSLRSPDR